MATSWHSKLARDIRSQEEYENMLFNIYYKYRYISIKEILGL